MLQLQLGYFELEVFDFLRAASVFWKHGQLAFVWNMVIWVSLIWATFVVVIICVYHLHFDFELKFAGIIILKLELLHDVHDWKKSGFGMFFFESADCRIGDEKGHINLFVEQVVVVWFNFGRVFLFWKSIGDHVYIILKYFLTKGSSILSELQECFFFWFVHVCVVRQWLEEGCCMLDDLHVWLLAWHSTVMHP